MNLCVIPARGGSKRIPHKNIRDFCGKPMIAWSIEAAIASKVFDHIVVSTDDEEIAEVAKFHGAVVPFVRPPHLSDDFAPTIPVIAHAATWVADEWGPVKNVCCIYATAPFVSVDDIRGAYEKLIETGRDYVFTVTSYAFPIQRSIRIQDQDRIEMFYPEHFDTRSQDLDEAFHDAGQFYWGKATAWTSGKILFGSSSSPWIIPRYRVQDIDTIEDWIRAEWLFKAMQVHVK